MTPLLPGAGDCELLVEVDCCWPPSCASVDGARLRVLPRGSGVGLLGPSAESLQAACMLGCMIAGTFLSKVFNFFFAFVIAAALEVDPSLWESSIEELLDCDWLADRAV